MVLKQVIRRFRICNYLCKIFRFSDFISAFMIFMKYLIVRKIAKFIYIAKQVICLKSPGQVILNYIKHVHLLKV